MSDSRLESKKSVGASDLYVEHKIVDYTRHDLFTQNYFRDNEKFNRDDIAGAERGLFAFSYLMENSRYLNSECKSMLDLGIGTGQQQSYLKEDKWKIIGYENSSFCLNQLRTAGYIESRDIDLNKIDPSTNRLAYQDQLRDDLSQVANIVAINTLQFIQYPALCMLLFDLIRFAQPNTVFFFVNRIEPQISKYIFVDDFHNPTYAKELRKQGRSNLGGKLKPNYVLSFFGGRTDFEVLCRKKREKDCSQSYEIVALRKR